MLKQQFDSEITSLKVQQQNEINSLKALLHSRWISVEPILLASFPSNEKPNQIYSKKLGNVPSNAKEVLIFVQSDCGGASGLGLRLDIYTKVNGQECHQYHYSYMYPQNAIGFNSDNLWFPISSDDLNLYWKLNTSYSTNCAASLYLIGYKV